MKILLATDASQTAEEAVDFLRGLPVAEELELILLSVVQMPELHHVLRSKQFEADFFHKQEVKLREHFEQIVSKFAGTSVRFQQRVLQGHPGKTIVSVAAELQVNAIVLGSVGESLIDRLLLGSTSKHVATNAGCSVLVVRATESKLIDLRILAAYDGSTQAVQALEAIVQSGIADGIPIDLVQVTPAGSNRQTEPTDGVEFQEDPKDTGHPLDQLVSQSVSLAPLDITSHVIHASHVGQALCEFAEKNPIGLIVLGSTGRGFLARMLLGSASKHVLQHATCSVWIGREAK